MELTLDQKRALAMASARARAAEAEEAPAPAAPEPTGQPVNALAASNIGARQGLTFNFGDEIMAGMTTPIEMAIGAWKGTDTGKGIGQRVSDAYSRGLEQERAMVAQAQVQQPVASSVGNIAGSLVTGGQLMKGGATLMKGTGSVASMAGRAGLEGAAYGALAGAGEGEDTLDRARKAAVGGAIGGAAGGALGTVAGALAGRNARVAAPTVEELTAAKTAAYQAADNAGVAYTPVAVDRLKQDVVNRLTQMGFDPANQPGAAPALKRILDLEGQNVTMTGLDTIRKVASGGYKVGEKSNNKAIAEIIDAIDGVMTSPQAGEVLSGDAAQGIAALKEGRAMASRIAKSDRLNQAEDFGDLRAWASGSGANSDNAVRQNVVRILKDPRGYSAEEQQALRAIVKGGPVQNIARLIGKSAPTTGGLNTLLHGATAYGSGGASIPFAVAGAAAKRVADAATPRNLAVADALIRSGGSLAAPALTDAQRAIAQLLNAQLAQRGQSAITN